MVVESKPSESDLFIEDILVERNHRRMGLGNYLIRYAEEIARNPKLRTISLKSLSIDGTGMNMDELNRWYSRMGFIHSRGMMFKHIL